VVKTGAVVICTPPASSWCHKLVKFKPPPACQLWHTLDRGGWLPSPHPIDFCSIIPKKANPYDQHLINNHRQNKKIIKYFTTKQNIVQSFFF